MRTRLVIPAALLVAAAYVKGRQDALPHERHPDATPPPVDLPDEVRRRAEAEAADALDLTGERVVEGAAAEAAATLAPPPLRPEDVAAADPWDAVRDWIVPEFPFARGRAAAPAGLDPQPVAEPLRAADPEPEPVAEPEPEPVAETKPEPFAAPEPVAAGAPEPPADPGTDLAGVAEWTAEPAPAVAPAPVGAQPDDRGAVLAEWVAPVAPMVAASAPVPPVVEVEIDEAGRFSLGGWAAQAGHMALTGVTFRGRREAPVAAGAIRLVPDALSNVADDGLVVLDDAGFAPCAEGFTLLVAAAGPGTFAATGRYEVVAG